MINQNQHLYFTLTIIYPCVSNSSPNFSAPHFYSQLLGSLRIRLRLSIFPYSEEIFRFVRQEKGSGGCGVDYVFHRVSGLIVRGTAPGGLCLAQFIQTGGK